MKGVDYMKFISFMVGVAIGIATVR